MQELMNALGIGGTVATVLVILFLLLNVVGEICTKMDKVVPSFMKIITKIKEKRANKKQKQKDHDDTLKLVKKLLDEVNNHYSEDNISKRDDWMGEVNKTMKFVKNQSLVYDNSLADIVKALNANTKMTEDMFVESSRDRIISFAEKAGDYDILLSREQFRRINRVYDEYEKFLVDHERTNGEVDIAYQTIQDGYRYRLQHHSFLEDIKGYKVKP